MAERDDQGDPVEPGEHADAEPQTTGPELQKLAMMISQRAQADMPPGVGFCVFVFTTGPGPGHTAYASTALRGPMLEMLRHFVNEADG